MCQEIQGRFFYLKIKLTQSSSFYNKSLDQLTDFYFLAYFCCRLRKQRWPSGQVSCCWGSLVTGCSVMGKGSTSIYIFNWVETNQDQSFIFFIWEVLIFSSFFFFSLFSAKIRQEENAEEKENIPRKLLSIMYCVLLKTNQSTSITTNRKS